MMAKEQKRYSLLLGLVPLLGVLLYLGGLDSPFVYDDEIVVVENPSIRTLSEPATLMLHDRFRPLVNLSYAVDYNFWQLRPRGYRLTNLGLHMAMVLLVAALLVSGVRDQDLGRSVAPAKEDGLRIGLSAAALFAVHPLLSEGVVYVSGRSELLAGTFLLTALLCWRLSVGDRSGVVGRHAKRRERCWLLVSLCCFVASMAAKEIGAVFPFLALAYDRLLLANTSDAGQQRQRLIRWHLPLVALVIFAGLARITSFVVFESEQLPRPFGVNWMLQAGVIWRYLGLFVWPVRQSIAYSSQIPEAVVTIGSVFAVLTLIAVLILLGTIVRKVSPIACFGGVWFFLVLAPSSVIPLNELMAEHRTYVATAGLVWVSAVVWARARARTRAADLVEFVVVLLLCQLTLTRVEVWSNPLDLWQQASVVEPSSWRAHHGLAEARLAAGDCEAAIPAFRRALELQPENAVPTSNLGICLAQVGEIAQARAVFERILRYDPKSLSAMNNLGRLALLTGDAQRAIHYFRGASRTDPNHPRSLTNLILVLHATGDRGGEVPELCSELSRLVVVSNRPEFCRGSAVDDPGE